MSTKRIPKLNSLIQQQLGEIIIKNIEFPEGCLISITNIEVSPENKYAHVYISVLPDSMRERALTILRQNSRRLQHELNKQLTTQFTPQLTFEIDEQEIFAAEIDKLLDEIK